MGNCSEDIVNRAKLALEGVSPGPWRVERSKYVHGWYVITAQNATAVHATEWGIPNEERFERPDFQFAAEARALVPELITEVERLRDLVDDADST